MPKVAAWCMQMGGLDAASLQTVALLADLRRRRRRLRPSVPSQIPRFLSVISATWATMSD